MVIPVVVGLALFMEYLDGMAIMTAIPAMAQSLNSDPAHLSLAVTAYLLTLAIFIPASGWVADRCGARTVFQVAMAIFTLASILCGISQTLPQLLIGRVLQGFGGALMAPVARLILIRTFPKSELVRAMSWFTIPGLIGPALGPPLGGFLTDFSSWRWIFLINVPVGVAGIVLTAFLIENYREPEAKPFDWRGFFLTGGALGSSLYSVDAIGHGAATGWVAAFLLLGALILVLLAIRHGRVGINPLIDLKLLRLPTFRVSNTGGLLFRIALNGAIVLQPVLVQVGFGMTAFQSALLTVCGAVGMIMIRLWIRHLLKRFGFRRSLIWNGLFTALTLGVVCFFTPGTPVVFFVAAYFACGVARSFQFMAISTIVYSDVPPEQASAATGFSSMADQFAAAVGASTAGILLQLAASWRGVTAEALTASDIQWAMGAMALLAVLSVPPMMRLRSDAGAEVSGHRRASSGPG